MALDKGNHNVVIDVFGPQLLLLENMLGANGKTYEEYVSNIAKRSSDFELMRYNENLNIVNDNSKLKVLKTRIASFVTSKLT